MQCDCIRNRYQSIATRTLQHANNVMFHELPSRISHIFITKLKA